MYVCLYYLLLQIKVDLINDMSKCFVLYFFFLCITAVNKQYKYSF